MKNITETENNLVTGGESVKVALRIRPMNNMELGRGDEKCVKNTCPLDCNSNISRKIFWAQVFWDPEKNKTGTHKFQYLFWELVKWNPE